MKMEMDKKFRLTICQVFQGPVLQSFVYTYYQTYSQDTDVYTYATTTEVGTAFSECELCTLKRERRPNFLSLPLLYKILQTCCKPILADRSSSVWDTSSVEVDPCKIESLLTFIYKSYQEFLRNCKSMLQVDFDDTITKLRTAVFQLIQNAGQSSGSKRWPEEQERLNTLFKSIVAGDTMVENCEGPEEAINAEAMIYSHRLQEVLSSRGIYIDDVGLDISVSHSPLVEKKSKVGSNTNEMISTADIIQRGEMNAANNEKSSVLIVGDHGVGNSSLATLFSFSWCFGDGRINGLMNYNVVILVSGSEICKIQNPSEIIYTALPMSCTSHSLSDVIEWLRNNKVLIAIDDIEQLDANSLSAVCCLFEEMNKLSLVLLGHPNFYSNASEDFFTKLSPLELNHNGFKEQYIIKKSENILPQNKANESFQTFVKRNLNRIGEVLRFPSLFNDTCSAWQYNCSLFDDIYTCSELMWLLLLWKVQTGITNCDNLTIKQLLNWMMIAGEFSICCLKVGNRLDGTSFNDLEEETIKIMNSQTSIQFLELNFKPRLVHSSFFCLSDQSSISKPQLEFLAGWYVYQMLMSDNKPITHFTSNHVNVMNLGLFVAGHFLRCRMESVHTVTEERKLIHTLVNYSDDSFEDLNFIHKFVAELKCSKKLVEYVVDETEYPEEWSLGITDIQLKPLMILLDHVSPIRLILLYDDERKNYELTPVLNFISKVAISVWLDSAPQFSYGNKGKMDKVLKPLLQDKVVPRVDLLSGYLSTTLTSTILTANATKYLVLLKLRITNEKALASLLKVYHYLPKLLWLEIKIDMHIMDLELANLESTQMALMDVHIRHVDDSSVTFLADLLSCMHNRYTGIHLEETTLTPEGVFTLLKELTKRKIKLHAENDSINKFRRWYYPQLTGIPLWRKLSDEEVYDIIGHDDRKFYSDHEVHSSKFVISLDAWNLTSYLEEQEDIVSFRFNADNILFTKELDGKVEKTPI